MPHLGTTGLSIVLTVAAVLAYGAVSLYGRWGEREAPEGRREAVRKKGLHPVTDRSGTVHASEEEQDDGGERSE